MQCAQSLCEADALDPSPCLHRRHPLTGTAARRHAHLGPRAKLNTHRGLRVSSSVGCQKVEACIRCRVVGLPRPAEQGSSR
eukprot:3311099-Prymnesium_polylepis.3